MVEDALVPPFTLIIKWANSEHHISGLQKIQRFVTRYPREGYSVKSVRYILN